jgi:hypothetical protein
MVVSAMVAATSSVGAPAAAVWLMARGVHSGALKLRLLWDTARSEWGVERPTDGVVMNRGGGGCSFLTQQQQLCCMDAMAAADQQIDARLPVAAAWRMARGGHPGALRWLLLLWDTSMSEGGGGREAQSWEALAATVAAAAHLNGRHQNIHPQPACAGSSNLLAVVLTIQVCHLTTTFCAATSAPVAAAAAAAEMVPLSGHPTTHTGADVPALSICIRCVSCCTRGRAGSAFQWWILVLSALLAIGSFIAW